MGESAVRGLGRTTWSPAHQDEFVEFGKVDAHPRPVRPGGVKIVVGGHTSKVKDRGQLP